MTTYVTVLSDGTKSVKSMDAELLETELYSGEYDVMPLDNMQTLDNRLNVFYNRENKGERNKLISSLVGYPLNGDVIVTGAIDEKGNISDVPELFSVVKE